MINQAHSLRFVTDVAHEGSAVLLPAIGTITLVEVNVEPALGACHRKDGRPEGGSNANEFSMTTQSINQSTVSATVNG